jgi:hypothetical protein
MTKEFVPYELALKLKELGFDEPCFGYHYTLNGKDWKFADNHEYCEIDDQLVIGANFTLLAPLFQQAFRWFREKYNLHAEFKVEDCVKLGEEKYYWAIFGVYESIEGTPWIRCLEDSNGVKSNNYEEAELATLDKLIEIVELKQQEQ